jgi:GWxTD domain-containing protein
VAQPLMRELDGGKLASLADQSLRTAAQLEPGNARYLLTAGRYRNPVKPGDPPAAMGAFVEKALAITRAGGDPALRGEAALESGRIHWFRYDAEAHRRLYLHLSASDSAGLCPHGLASSLDSATHWGKTGPDTIMTYLPLKAALNLLHSEMEECTSPLKDAGDGEYRDAEALFREALDAAPDDPRVFRHMAMLLAEKNRWRELTVIARERVARHRDESLALLVLGLASHRDGQQEQAGASFDSAVAHLSPPERARLFSFARLLPHKDSLTYVRAPETARANTERGFWAMADALWSRPGDDPRYEFYARITYAELRWTVEELGVRGADSDRGEIYVRYGPPDTIAVVRGGDYSSEKNGPMDQSGPGFTRSNPNARDAAAARMPQPSDIVTIWDYNNGLTMVFWGAPGYGTARIPQNDGGLVQEAIDSRSAAFDNLASGRIDEIPLRTARFRAGGDSVELVFLTRVPLAAIHGGSAANAPVKEFAWLFGRDVPNAYRDSMVVEGDGTKAWVYRVPKSMFMYRVEATADGSSVSGRASTWINANSDTVTGFALRGFGMSDVLLATIAESRTPTPSRWRDFDFTPLLGTLPKRSNLEMVWENYELGQRNGQAQYQVTITVQRVRSAAGRIAAQIIGMAASAVGITRRDDRVILQIERATPYAPRIADHIGMALADTPAGTYRVALEINDRTSGRKTSRSTEITIQ